VQGGLLAVAPGEFTLSGLRRWQEGGSRPVRPLRVVVAAGPPVAELTQPAALALALEAEAAGVDVAPWLARWPASDGWSSSLLPEVARLRFLSALSSTAAERIARFEELREVHPSTSLDFAAVASVARAYHEAGRPDRAVTVWRAGLAAAFLAEASSSRRLEDTVGLLASLQAMREVTWRYPSVSAVEEATFHLPERLASMADADALPVAVRDSGITATDLRLTAAAWDREFIALHPDAPRVPQAGFHLVQNLLRLRAWEQASEWSSRLAERHPDSELLDGFVYMEGLALSELGQDSAALARFGRVATEEFPEVGGTLGPARSRGDGRYAAARLREARGDVEAARKGYEGVAGSHVDAARSLQALTRVRLEPDLLLRVDDRQPARLPVRVANLAEVQIRAYRLDLRTVFLRDGGLDAVTEVEVDGVSPAWSGAVRVSAGPFPRDVALPLPLHAPGAYLVQLDGGGLSRVALVVRSGLSWSDEDDGQVRRLTVVRGDRAAAGVQVRAVGAYGAVVATTTDLRGVALVPSGAAALIFDGDHYGFTRDVPYALERLPSPYGYGAEPAGEDLMKDLDARVIEQRADNFRLYEQGYSKTRSEEVEALAL
jgi:hypothetical protein